MIYKKSKNSGALYRSCALALAEIALQNFAGVEVCDRLITVF
jgi:hypothetical protein